ncbi:MAG: hypothetical protein E7283_08030 [Lachnospiraceae bacterium]|nr:hypothetical protein [Lachnospiraceae bacterium]
MGYTIKPFEELDVMDDFLANAIANDQEVGEEFYRILISVLLQKEVGKIRISAQRIIPAEVPTQRGIRLDIEVVEYAEGMTELQAINIYDIEPHKYDGSDLPKHNRFYQAKIDGKSMKSGEKTFIKLPNLYVITITDYDPFDYGYMMYTVHNKCDEVPELDYQDGLKFLYFNTKGSKGGSQAIKNLLNYIQDSKIKNVIDESTRKLHTCVSKVKVLPEVRMEYMTLEEKIFYIKLNAKEDGKAEGKAEAILELLSEYGDVPEEIVPEIMRETDLERLTKWLKLAAKTKDVQEFINQM